MPALEQFSRQNQAANKTSKEDYVFLIKKADWGNFEGTANHQAKLALKNAVQENNRNFWLALMECDSDLQLSESFWYDFISGSSHLLMTLAGGKDFWKDSLDQGKIPKKFWGRNDSAMLRYAAHYGFAGHENDFLNYFSGHQLAEVFLIDNRNFCQILDNVSKNNSAAQNKILNEVDRRQKKQIKLHMPHLQAYKEKTLLQTKIDENKKNANEKPARRM